ncbi:hypothetical protein Golomagni_05656, partial [Golovinomyces magnicellulatus]
DIFPYAVVVPILPFALQSKAGVPLDKTQLWVSISLASFGAAILVSAPVWGILADRTKDRRTPMLLGLILLLGATFLLCFMHNVTMLVLGRVFQGMTSSLTWSVGLALVVDTVPADSIGKYMGWIGIAVSLATLTSPLLGGVVYGKGGYYQVWAMCFAIVAGDIVLRLLVIEKKHAVKWLGEESSTALTPTDDPKTQGTTQNPKDTSGQPTTDIEAATTVADHLNWKRIASLFRNGRFLAALWGTVIEATILTAFDSTLPIFVKDTFGWDSIGAGLAFLPLILPTFLGPLVGHLCDRIGPRWPSTFGFFFTIPFLVSMRFVTENTIADKVLLCGLLVGVGISNTCCFGPLTAEITWTVEEGCKDQNTKPIAFAYAMYNVAFSAGALIGPLLGGFVNEHKGWAAVGWTLAIVAGAAGVTTAIWVGGPPLWQIRKTQTPDENHEME